MPFFGLWAIKYFSAKTKKAVLVKIKTFDTYLQSLTNLNPNKKDLKH